MYYLITQDSVKVRLDLLTYLLDEEALCYFTIPFCLEGLIVLQLKAPVILPYLNTANDTTCTHLLSSSAESSVVSVDVDVPGVRLPSVRLSFR